ncbi:hypothetical protein D0T53_09400 [Dysgonomonas sp. 216]|uniref:glycosyl hydrolase 115 family protein n=1 Tax=Dysgonomonas sp. 216 TaxID=2302934 RepID=UPI001C884025|nr:glycosyl hydrolase 115 family protein [Dysgonomonas sp. 216]NDW19127.1 hypothetical protein [Dysgonomonas sp. 216]
MTVIFATMKKTALFLMVFGCVLFTQAAPVYLVNEQASTVVFSDKNEDVVVQTAIDLFLSDIEKVSGVKPSHVRAINSNTSVIVGTVGKSPLVDKLIKDRKISVDKINGKWEAFQIQVINHDGKSRLLVLGSDRRGTAYGILELSRTIGVSPWEWWADVVPAKQSKISIPDDFFTYQQPSVQYRGIFLNDEDWGLMPWSSKTFEPEGDKGRIGPETYGKIFELLLRLRANTLWPAMHECTIPFYFVSGNQQMADKYGIVIGTSHCEPLMRNNAGEWDKNKYGEYNYLTNKNTIQNYWAERLLEVGKSENFYTIGMRGVHDGKMEGAKTLDEQTTVLDQAIKDQRLLLEKYVNKNISDVPQAFIPYKEVLEVYDNNLPLPDDVTLVWCDDNYGYITRLSNEAEQKRKGGSGVYYHISYWGRPHDYLWLSSTQPAQIYWQMKNAWNNNARKLWILNVGDIKPAEYNIELFMDMAWNIDMFSAENASSHPSAFYQRDFGDNVSEDISKVMDEYYRLASVRKPEFMGWSRVEEHSAIKGGKTPVVDTEFNPYEFNDEIKKRLDAYMAIAEKVIEIKKSIKPENEAAYFQLVEYPVLASAEMNKKLLYAQKARLYARYGLLVANEYAAKSRDAYSKIGELTKKYNGGIVNGKWNRFMDMKPRNLAVFQESELPEPVVTNESAEILVWGEGQEMPLEETKEIKLPDFVRAQDNKSFISLLLKGNLPVKWSVNQKPDWLTVKEDLTGLNAEKRLLFSVDWTMVLTEKAIDTCVLNVNGVNYTVKVGAINRNQPIAIETKGMIALNAKDGVNLDKSKHTLINGLGHSNAAVELKKGEENALVFELYTVSAGDAVLRTCLVPNHPVDEDLRFAISVDGAAPKIVSLKTKFRSEPWKVNVLRNQAVNESIHVFDKPGKHTIKIYALDRGIILDQVMLDFDKERMFYEVPAGN